MSCDGQPRSKDIPCHPPESESWEALLSDEVLPAPSSDLLRQFEAPSPLPGEGTRKHQAVAAGSSTDLSARRLLNSDERGRNLSEGGSARPGLVQASPQKKPFPASEREVSRPYGQRDGTGAEAQEQVSGEKAFLASITRKSATSPDSVSRVLGRLHCSGLVSPGPSAASLCDLPQVLLHEVLRHLEARDLGRISCCCKLFCQLVLESPGWQRFYCDRWRPPTGAPGRPAREHTPLSTQSPAPPTPPRNFRGNSAASTCAAIQEDDRGGSCGRPSGGGSERSGHGLGQSGSPEWWRQLYLHKEKRSAALMGRYDSDWFTGHTAGVRSVAVLPQAPIAASVGYDSTVRLWDLDRMLPLAASAPLGETLRAVAADWDFLAVGGTDCVVRVWPLALGCPHFFDVDGLWDCGGGLNCAAQGLQGEGQEMGGRTAPCAEARGSVCSPHVPALLRGHTGPISCLAAHHGPGSGPRVLSGSWDCTIICWDVAGAMVCPEPVPGRVRGSLRRSPSSGNHSDASMMRYYHDDWVWSAVARRGHLFSTSGAALYSWDTETGALLRVRSSVHEGKANAVEASMSGHYVFTGGEDGYVRMFDERARGKERRREHSPSNARGAAQQPAMEWLAHGAPVNSLSLEDPWLVSASTDGCCAVMEVGKAMRADKKQGKHSSLNPAASGSAIYEPVRRLGGASGSLLSVDMGHERVVAGCVDTTVRVLDFRRAEGTPEPKRRARKKGGGRKLVRAYET